MPLATTSRPPVLASVCLLGAVVLGPAAHTATTDQRALTTSCVPHELTASCVQRLSREVVAGIPRGDLYEAPNGIDPWIFQTPPGGTVAMPNAVLQHDLVWHPKARPLAMDRLVSGFLRLLTGDPV